MRKVLILGGGTAGTMVANKLRSRYPADELALTVVDRDDDHHYQPGYLFLPFGTYTEDMIVRSRHNFIPDGVELVLGEIDRVDPEGLGQGQHRHLLPVRPPRIRHTQARKHAEQAGHHRRDRAEQAFGVVLVLDVDVATEHGAVDVTLQRRQRPGEVPALC